MKKSSSRMKRSLSTSLKVSLALLVVAAASFLASACGTAVIFGEDGVTVIPPVEPIVIPYK
jgi:predicted small secreted protein